MGRLEGKSAIVTGAASGIGRASSILFAAEGAKLVIADKADAVHETAEMITKAGGTVVAVTGDAGDEAFVESLVKRAVADYGKLDVFYANAGIIGPYVPITEVDAAGVAELLRVNLIGPMLAVKHAAKVMIPAGKGSIICTASVAGIRSGAGPAPYSASKAGVMNLAATAANELYGTGVRVNAIHPGVVITELHKNAGLDEEAYSAFLERSKATENASHLLLRPFGQGTNFRTAGIAIGKAAGQLLLRIGQLVPGFEPLPAGQTKGYQRHQQPGTAPAR